MNPSTGARRSSGEGGRRVRCLRGATVYDTPKSPGCPCYCPSLACGACPPLDVVLYDGDGNVAATGTIEGLPPLPLPSEPSADTPVVVTP